MSVVLRGKNQKRVEGKLLAHAKGLLGQQVWCWGRDILRPEGNWLVELGFDRIAPPSHRKSCASVYSLAMPHKRWVALRGFGVFYGDGQLGGIFLFRSMFQPLYTKQARLDSPPWSVEDLPMLSTPTKSQQPPCATLTLDLIDWIRGYEENIIEQLGIEYRRATLRQWDNGTRPFVPAENFASAWRELSFQVASNFKAFLGPSQP